MKKLLIIALALGSLTAFSQDDVQGKKKDLMNEYFLNNGFKLDEPIFNIEFEMRRKLN